MFTFAILAVLFNYSKNYSMGHCNWCNGYVDVNNSYKAGWGLKMRIYCSNRCKTYGEEAREKSQGKSNTGGFLSKLFNNDSPADEGPSLADKENDKFDF